MKMKKIMALTMATVMGASLLTACGGGSGTTSTTAATTAAAETTAAATTAAAGETAAETTAAAAEATAEPVTITFWHAMSNAQEVSLTELTDKFNAENGKGITVELVNQGGYSDLQTKLMASAAADTLPDMAQAYNNYFTDYVDKIIPLDDFVKNDFDNWEDIVEGYRIENSEYGFITGVPFNKSTYPFFYNKTMFDRAGITEPPTTWEDLEKDGAILLEKEGVPMLGYDSMCDMLEIFLRQNGADYVDETGALFDTPEGLEAIEFILGLYSKGYARLIGEDAYFSNLMSSEMIGGYVGSCAGVTYIVTDNEGHEFELGVAPIAQGKKNAAYNAGTNLVMFTKDEAKQKAVWEYMKFLTSAESQVKWSIDTGYVPVRTSAYESQEYQDFMAGDTAGAITARAAYGQAPYGYVPSNYFPGANEIRNVVSDTLTVCISEGKTAQETLDELVTAINDVVQ